MLSMDDLESGTSVTHKNTGLPYSVTDIGEDEVLLSADKEGLQDLLVPIRLFREEFALTDRFSTSRGRGRRRPGRPAPSGPRVKGRIKKLVRDRGFGFVRGDDGKEVFFASPRATWSSTSSRRGLEGRARRTSGPSARATAPRRLAGAQPTALLGRPAVAVHDGKPAPRAEGLRRGA
jgi:hypothetical protein